jgi:hypothetical protein
MSLSCTDINFYFLPPFHKAGSILMETGFQKVTPDFICLKLRIVENCAGNHEEPRQQATPQMYKSYGNCALFYSLSGGWSPAGSTRHGGH